MEVMLKHPLIAVPDLARSSSYYRDVLGFRVHEIGDPGQRFYERDACLILAGECPDAIPPAELGEYFAYVLADQIDSLFTELTIRGAQLTKKLFGIRTVVGTGSCSEPFLSHLTCPCSRPAPPAAIGNSVLSSIVGVVSFVANSKSKCTP